MPSYDRLIRRIEKNPVIAAIRKEEDVKDALDSGVSTVFLLRADIFSIKLLVEMIKLHEKDVFIHIDFLEGLGRDHRAIDYIAEIICPDGIITTRSSHVKYARERGVFTIQRFFLLDSQSFDTTIKSVQSIKPDMVEVMPAVMPNVIKRVCAGTHLPVIAGGLVETKEEIMEILNAGALGVSTGKKELWLL